MAHSPFTHTNPLDSAIFVWERRGVWAGEGGLYGEGGRGEATGSIRRRAAENQLTLLWHQVEPTPSLSNVYQPEKKILPGL